MSTLLDFFQRHFKTLDDVGTAFVILALIVFGIGNLLNLERVQDLGIASLGAAVVAWGANAIQTRELRIFQHGIRIGERVNETLARVWGVVFCAGGLGLLGFGILSALNPRAPIPAGIQNFFATQQGTGVILLGAGSVGILFALTSIFGGDSEGGSAFVRFVLSLPGRLFGILLLVIFAALAVSGALLIFAPGVLMDLWQSLLQALAFR